MLVSKEIYGFVVKYHRISILFTENFMLYKKTAPRGVSVSSFYAIY